MGRTWNEVESDLRTGWDKFEYRPERGSTWENMKDAVRDAWHRITGQQDLDVEQDERIERRQVDVAEH